jgi:formylglycine-generating enzyme required for sulfatase activity
VGSGTNAGTAVYNNANITGEPAVVDSAGGLSPYGTMGQGGNVWEWMETAFDGENSSTSEARVRRGGTGGSSEDELSSSFRLTINPSGVAVDTGFRVASIPEPSTYALILLGAGALYLWKHRKGSL